MSTETSSSTASLPHPNHQHDDHDTSHPSSSQSSSSILSTFAYPVSYTVTGLLRRISADEAPTPLARALSANFNDNTAGSGMGGLGGVFGTAQPPLPRRRLSPFQPPPLTPLDLTGWKESTGHKGRLLSRSLAEEIRLLVPPRLQLVQEWRLAYSLEQDGSSIGSLYGLCERYRGKRGGFVVVVRDGLGGIFGAYLSDAPHPSPHYYGTGECFLWRCFRLPSLPDLSSLPPPPSEDTTNLGRMTTITLSSNSSSTTSLASLSSAPPSSLLATSAHSTRNSSPAPNRFPPGSSGGGGGGGPAADTPASSAAPSRAGRRRAQSQPLRFKAFPYTGENDFTILCGADYLSVGGGGNGRYGLWLDDRLARGVSGACETFGNEPLSEAGGKFEVLGVEVWYLGAS